MKYLISFNTNIVNQEQAAEWNVDKILVWGTNLKTDLSNLPQDDESLTFFIPTVADYNNSLSYEGANLALIIIMRYLRAGRTDIHIVLMGNEKKSNFLVHYDYPNILKIPGFHYLRFNKNVVAQHQVSATEQLMVCDYAPYLENLGLKIPSSFKSTHSLANEWCLFKWNSFMGFNEDTSLLDGHLYFEYLLTLEKLYRVKTKTATAHLIDRIHNLPNARILLIDDNQGWHTFFNTLFTDAPNIELRCLGEDFSKLKFEDIEQRIIGEINDFEPNVIILDFRLMEDKDEEIKDNMKEISGYKVLAKILKGTFNNPLDSYGRQVLIFTATGRIENILMLQNGNADGFILKEKPETYNGKEITKHIISKMVSAIENAIARANFLIPLNAKLKELSILNLTSHTEVQERIVTVSESIRLTTQNNILNEGILKLVYLNLFSILEFIKPPTDRFINDYVQRNAPDGSLEYWNNIDSLRNSLAHGDGSVFLNRRKIQVSSSVIMKWTLILCDFIKEFIKKNLVHV